MSATGSTGSTVGQCSAGGSAGHGRNRGNRGSGRGGSGKPARIRSTFKGNTGEMNGCVFECYDEQSDRRQYAKKLEALEVHVKKVLKNC
jgi:hypothetical protein